MSVGKPVQSFGQFVEAARRKTLLVGATSVVAVLVLVVILSVWLVRPFGLIADYARYVRAQRSFSLPPASANLWMVVINTLRTSCASSSCNSLRVGRRVGYTSRLARTRP